MKFTLSTTLLALALSASDAAAARIEIRVTTGPGLIPSGSTVLIGNDGVHNNFGYFLDGCKGPGGRAWLQRFCIDSGNNRAHVSYTSGLKRCFRRTRTWSELCGGDESCWGGVCNRCWEYDYTEAACTW
ncbi:hypothetical protein SVAN01_00387 [Stagonosporopsis vannaccii]|nr:hypothetical protein SVAN01_00387 [Stagonosporopsis vannaccii]